MIAAGRGGRASPDGGDPAWGRTPRTPPSFPCPNPNSPLESPRSNRAGAAGGANLPEQAPHVGDVLAQDLAGVGFSLVLDGQAAVVIQALELAQQGLKINHSLPQ